MIVAKGESAWGLTRFRNLNRVTFRTHNGLELHDLSSPVDLDPLTWYHVAGTFDAASKTKALYINGELVVQTIYAGPIQTNDFKCLIGENEEKPNRAFDGEMDTVRIWNVARTAAQIKASVQREVYGNEPGIVAVYRFNDEPANSTTVLDSSKNPLSGTTKFIAPAVPNRVAGVAMGAPVIQDRVIELNGTDEYVRLRHEDQFDFTNEMSLEAWVYMSGGSGNRTIASKGSGWNLGLNAAGNAVFTGSVGNVTSATVAIIADAGFIADRDQEQIQRWRRGRFVADMAVSDQAVIDPAELIGHLAETVRIWDACARHDAAPFLGSHLPSPCH